MSVHGSSSAELEELASAFALEALLPEETESYVRHLGSCQFCRQLVAECRAAVDLLPLGLEEELGSPGLKQRILAQAAQELEQESRQPAGALDKGETRTGIRWPAWLSLNPARAAAALAVVVVGLIAWNITLQLDNGGPNGLTAAQLNLIESIGSGATIIELTGTNAAPDANARLIRSADSDAAFLILRNMPQIAPGEAFEIWSIREGVPTSVGTFAPNAEQEQLVSFSADVSDAQNVGISIEPKNGSPTGQPTGPIVLLGSL